MFYLYSKDCKYPIFFRFFITVFNRKNSFKYIVFLEELYKSFIKKHKTIKGALAGTAIGVGVCTVLACVLNWLVLIPAYIKFSGYLTLEDLIEMMNYIPNITVTADNFMLVYIFVGVLPFNLFRYLIVGLLTFLLYKKTHIVLSKLAG